MLTVKLKMMKSLYNYILLAVMAFATVGCLGELNTDIPSAESGDEVQFGLSLPSMTRTTYGEKNAEGTAYPIYWVDGDKVQVYSPQCLAGRNDAEYKVSVESATQNFATSLTPTGANGVQWGNESAMFYSVYPSGDYTISDDGKVIENLKINFSDEFEVTQDAGGNNVVTPKGADCLMFAKTSEAVEPGSTVNLSYSPMATSVIITLQGPSENSAAQEVTIQSVKLIAPEGTFIAGYFNVEYDDELKKYVHTSWVDGAEKSNSITAQVYDKSTSAFHVIEGGETIEIPIFLAPIEGLAISADDDTEINDDWRIEVLVQAQYTEEDPNKIEVTKDVVKTFTKKLKFAEGFNATLKPGMVHEFPALPTLDIISDGSLSDWEVGDWMENIPRNVYLSEVSIPGTWNSINADYQKSVSITQQYAAGVRAFHFDTRWRTSDTEVSWAGYLEGQINGLSVAGGADSGKYNSGSGDRVVSGSAKTFAEYLKEITDNIINDNAPKLEYMILMCTFAQDSYNYTDAEGDDWVSEISKACDDNAHVFDSKNLTENTVVGDVLGKVIVIVNMEGSFTTVPNNSKCLFVNLPLTLTSSLFGSTLNDNNSGNIYKGSSNSTEVADSGIDMYHTQAQISIAGEQYNGTQSRDNVMSRGFAPTFGERKTVANNILNWSKSNYGTENYKHDKWIYLGLGGYYSEYSSGIFGFGAGWQEVSGSNETVAEDFNTWINGKVTEMGTSPDGQKVPYYPVGIVLMNFAENYPEEVENILLLNNKYRLQFDPDKPADYLPSTTSAAASYSSGMHDSNTAAFGWD